jgi:AcrR family transcriptional regulator
LAVATGINDMPRTTKDKTRRNLRDAVVAEAVEKGIGAVSVAGVVERAHVSAGTVYVHFENKDDMLRKIYMEIKSEFHQLMLAARSEMNSEQMIRRMWFDMFAFVSEHPTEFLFLEYGNAAKILTPDQQITTQRMHVEIGEMLRRGVDDGTLAPLDSDVLTLLLVAPALQLARSAVLKSQTIPPETLELIFRRVWLSVSDPIN